MESLGLTLQPGVSTQTTKLLGSSGYNSSNNIRFHQGLLQKMGGWIKYTDTALNGVCRSLCAWETLDRTQYLCAGTNKRLQLFGGPEDADITPIRATSTIPPVMTTSIGSDVVIIEDVAHGANDDDGIFIAVPVSIGGIIIYGYYSVTNIDADHYSIITGTVANSAIVGGGDVPFYSTSNGIPDINVTFEDHGKIEGDIFTVHISTTVGGVTLDGDYIVDSVVDTDNFVIVASTNASSTASAYENSGDTVINYLLESGNADAVPAQGYGVGGYGEGLYGYGGSSGANDPPRQWSLSNWGEDLISSYTDGPIYIWDASAGIYNNPSTIIPNAPSNNRITFIAMPQRQLWALATSDDGQQDMLLIKWSHVDNYTKWRNKADSYDPNSQAGFYRLPRGSKIVGGGQASQQILIWTDLALWIAQYIGPKFIYSFNEIATGCGLIASRAWANLGGITYWMTEQGFDGYSGGGVQPIPCDVWDKIFPILDKAQAEKITCCANSTFGEVTWEFPSINGDGECDMYVKYTPSSRAWDYGFKPEGRTAWIDKNIFGSPIGAGANGYIYQHEIGNDADDQAMDSFAESGWFTLSEGTDFIFIERLLPDVILEGEMNITLKFADYPNENDPTNVITEKSFTVTNSTKYVIVRARGRFASIRFGSNSLDSFWRIGKPLFFFQKAGRR